MLNRWKPNVDVNPCHYGITATENINGLTDVIGEIILSWAILCILETPKLENSEEAQNL
jgi:hypothetical protein